MNLREELAKVRAWWLYTDCKEYSGLPSHRKEDQAYDVKVLDAQAVSEILERALKEIDQKNSTIQNTFDRWQKAMNDREDLQSHIARLEKANQMLVENIRYVADKMGFGNCKGCNAMTIALTNHLAAFEASRNGGG